MRLDTELSALPVAEALPALREALARGSNAVLVAPPGAGKTTLVPLVLAEEAWAKGGRILVLEPRRLAARGASRRMASMIGEEVGKTVGHAMRMERRFGADTSILVVTEGLLVRMILDDPELSGVSAVLFDEFHERSLDADFGLALALDIQSALRPDLRILVMSATLDGARVARLLGDAPVIESRGRAFPVDIRYREQAPGTKTEQSVADAAAAILREEGGSALAFLPGLREIERTASLLEGRLPGDCDIIPLHGGLDGRAQDAAIRPAPFGRRKLVLSTAIAETSVTIDGVRIVIDCGLSRQPVYEPASGLTRLETVRASRASVDQRAGRAGRTEPGIALRLWRAEQTAALPAFAPPEILQADLCELVLSCAAFGVSDPAGLAFLDQPPAPALAEARALLVELGALDAEGRITKTGEKMRALALPVRLAHMLAQATQSGHAREAAELAVLLGERGLGGNDIDLDHRLDRFRREKGTRADAARRLAERLARSAGGGAGSVRAGAGSLLLHAYPDRVARARGEHGRFVLANGRGGVIDAGHRLAASPFLVVADLQGKASNARIAAAAAISEDDIRQALGERFETLRETVFDPARRAVRVAETVRLGAIVLETRQLPAPRGEDADTAVLEAIRRHGPGILAWGEAASTLRERLSWLHATLGEPWPDMADEALIADLEDWLAPYLPGEPSLSAISGDRLRNALLSRVPFDLQREIDRLAPARFTLPTGNTAALDYREKDVVLSARVQELFGLTRHPAIAGGKVPLLVELLSPAHRPIQTTRDLPGFWRGSWAEVRADMRGRYPKHVWPENPAEAAPTSRAKPRGR
ncbi:ATP-dependent helicase HrpB [Chelativorans sp. ZYF759]|uniref:ATP-dependent helicase HrpB n=1 Tax=Chelativorans sp. ZYF759 TaxID=2692213 RepID=UPI0016B1C1E9|nr:ATP-dependent helicase HrpB [Chelativorans sp. ZYF759]NMG37897.1 ATP-dependent helicase HrpB [Chelativorans sp. ZYF759]